jgi:hypothetical protein
MVNYRNNCIIIHRIGGLKDACNPTPSLYYPSSRWLKRFKFDFFTCAFGYPSSRWLKRLTHNLVIHRLGGLKGERQFTSGHMKVIHRLGGLKEIVVLIPEFFDCYPLSR